MMFQDYTSDLHALAAMVGDRNALEEVLERALEALQAVVPYDLAAVFRLQGDQLRLVAAAGPLVSPEVRRHELPLWRFPTLCRALELCRPVSIQEHHPLSEEGDPFDGVLDLPHGHACMVVPLFAGERSLGIITLDRSSCGSYAEGMVQLAGV